jgi:hypothetical protein
MSHHRSPNIAKVKCSRPQPCLGTLYKKSSSACQSLENHPQDPTLYLPIQSATPSQSDNMSKSTFIASLCALSGVLANNAIPEHYFTDNNGDLAADAGSPYALTSANPPDSPHTSDLTDYYRMWHFASGSCLSSAAEDGQGHQTDGVDVPVVLCGINQKQDEGCPGDSSWQGFNTFYHGAAGEPWDVVPTYYASRKCGDGSWVCYISASHSLPGFVN